MKQAVLSALLPTFLHSLELLVILGAVYLATSYLGLEVRPEVTTLVLAAIVKFGRMTTKDYVNK